MALSLGRRWATARSGIGRDLTVLAVGMAFLLSPDGLLWSAEDRQSEGTQGDSGGEGDSPIFAARKSGQSPSYLKVVADTRLEEPLRAIAGEYGRRSGWRIALKFLSAADIGVLVSKGQAECDVVLSMAADVGGKTAVSGLAGARRVAWKHPGFEPVWAAAITEQTEAAGLVRFAGGPTGHRLWSESKAGFTIVPDASAEAYAWVVEHRVKHTYPMTAMRMLAECGGIREGVCVDVGCGTGQLDVELARRSQFTIVGLDINPEMKPLFEKTIRGAGLEDRAKFVLGDAQKLPFPDDYADVIFSRGTLIFIPDIKKCLQEVDRVLKPTGVAFLGGRYVYTPQMYKRSTEELKKIVQESGVAGAQVVNARGQWVKIVGAEAPEAARRFQGGPQMLAGRFVADYGISEGRCLLLCGSDGDLQQGLQRGFVNITELEITALYSSEKAAGEAEKRLRDAKLTDRITCKVGKIDALPFGEDSFNLVAGVGPVLVFEKDKANAIREIHRVLRPGGAALVGGRYHGMPDGRKVSSQSLREIAEKTGLRGIRVIDDMGQWVEIRKGIQDRVLRD